jgi:preprotein translocase subunit Sec61beta
MAPEEAEAGLRSFQEESDENRIPLSPEMKTGATGIRRKSPRLTGK